MQETMKKTMKKTMQKNRKGFTLVELIVVIAILAVLAAAAIAGYAGVTQNARQSQARSNAATICNAVNNHLSIATTPSANIGGAALVVGASGTDATGTTATALVNTTTGANTLDLSIAPTAPGGVAGAAIVATAAGPVNMTLTVTLTGAEWADALRLIEVSGTTWTVGNGALA